MALTRQDWLLLFIGLPGGSHPTDQLRVMKGMFLFSQEGPRQVRDLYDFQPYSYGPFDTQIYRDLDQLEIEGLIRADIALGTNRRIYRLTKKGEEIFPSLHPSAPATWLDILRRVKQHVTSLSFTDLLNDIYDRYPDYAVNSVRRS
jgi:DNA-binding PadR family transcriptional regulator